MFTYCIVEMFVCDLVKMFSGPFKKTSFCLAYILDFAFFACNAINNVRAFAVYIIFASVCSVCSFAGNFTCSVWVATIIAVRFLADSFCFGV